MKEVYVDFALTGVPQQESFSFFTLLQQDSIADHLLKHYEGDKELVKAKIKNLNQIPYVPFLPSDFTLYDEDGEIAEMRCVKDKKELNSVNSHIENVANPRLPLNRRPKSLHLIGFLYFTRSFVKG
ncbi:hypothetical protein G6F57_006684 [Rhizopus arrhizus]|uniref:Uncharacterized protein n=1 Tax=Rhizopus oryzae TaxID=64495 RepID=A0A9P6X941_RHIOR|nr:hypothetical protein G6F30_007735 [Rhizopus arrhizus]KAG1416982.1 hypothetical protein G6F58_005711 [Rhizopus delemar]KAG0983900.1 hypothetical protein G6F29_005176 [Rhizopus arrhizus]KAG0995735.1 hypothetical protein G6F28_004508 [Rhizopus arrhizus]KAG1009599.1 hypothetical protein G6F27_005429 [Rhizopus arrhizus]